MVVSKNLEKPRVNNTPSTKLSSSQQTQSSSQHLPSHLNHHHSHNPSSISTTADKRRYLSPGYSPKNLPTTSKDSRRPATASKKMSVHLSEAPAKADLLYDDTISSPHITHFMDGTAAAAPSLKTTASAKQIGFTKTPSMGTFSQHTTLPNKENLTSSLTVNGGS